MKRVGYEVRDEHQTGVSPGLLRSEFDLMQGLLKQFLVDSLTLHILEGLENHFLAVGEVFHRNSLDTDGEGWLSRSGVVASTWAEVWSDSFLDDRFVKGCIRAAQQDRRQHIEAERFVVIFSWDQVAQERDTKLSLTLSRAHQVRHKILLLVDCRLQSFFQGKLRSMRMLVPFEVRRNYLFLDELQVAGEIEITVCEKVGIGRMVVHLVELHELVVLQVSDVLGIATRVEAVLAVLEEVFIELVNERTLRVTHRTFHLIIDDAFVLKTARGILGGVKF